MESFIFSKENGDYYEHADEEFSGAIGRKSGCYFSVFVDFS